MTAWLVILSVAAGSFVLRATMFALVTTKPLPLRFEAALGFVGPAAIAAGFVAVRKTGNVMHAFSVGLPMLWIMTPVFG